MTIFEKIINLLNANNIIFDVIEHPAEGRTEVISKIRGNPLQQATKAMVLQVQYHSGISQYVLAIIPGDSKVNFKSIAILMGGKKSKFAPPQIAQELTQCQMGAIPPFSFDDRLSLCIDKRLNHTGRLYFNAGELDKSVSMDAEDYFRIATQCFIGEISIR
ncbi:YbaK/prolyl-tRNA synthetase associated domain-containing protein [Salmonella enterica]|uniref:YbaK/prolyl-tRNA synthetase associated domain-containing protein n=1 Tax=Salmonella enterica TaxID=28901 RepID=A0A5T8B7S6_SALER|nr:YbaK/prolyl-tRNA synthetase associated domain-containing protein [Salmonella enterica]EBN4400446.1 YbaK/prolyl-tRNA synthetase associated domain-containing protein [Salmonella enterica]